jgi:4-hydroxy-3-polyprenylbenzoate decarboxylase
MMSPDQNRQFERRVLIAVTGASGSIYAERLIEECVARFPRVYVIATDAARQVADHELAQSHETGRISLRQILSGEIAPEHRDVLRVFKNDDLFAPVASGSSAPTDMVVVPCSMGSLARMAQGLSSNLIERAADVVMKQRRRLILVPRETPLNTIHLRNMLTLSETGVDIVPAMPAFYQHPKSVDDMVNFVVGRVLELLEMDHGLYRPWNSRMR